MIVITGAAGFIGSNLAALLLRNGYSDLVLVDDFSKTAKRANFATKKVTAMISRDEFATWLDGHHKFVQMIFHLGARTDTTEFDLDFLHLINTEYTKTVWQKCCDYGLPLVYASSAATYGNGNNGFDDRTDPNLLQPLNAYGLSKNDFDKWALAQDKKPYFWAGLKFFNVYGPNEYHKGRMASVIYHAYNQIVTTGKLELFKSHRTDYGHGEQRRDFVYVKDVVGVMYYFLHHRDGKNSGLYNVGTGNARTFNDLGRAVFAAMNLPPAISYIDIPTDIRDKYQYFTEAKMDKLRSIGCVSEFYTLEAGILDYVRNYLAGKRYE